MHASHRLAAPVLFCALSLLSCPAGGAPRSPDRPPADVPLGHWSYPVLERLVSRGVLALDLTTRPLARSDVARAVASAGGDEASESLTEREAWLLSRLEAEFLRGEVDSPAFHVADGVASLGLGITALTQIRYGKESVGLTLWPGTAPGGITRANRAAGGAAGGAGRDVGIDADADASLDGASDVGYELWGGVGDLVGFYADTQVLLGGQDGARQVQLSSRVRTWRGISASSERAYLKLERPHYSVMLGRRGTAWGRARWGRLLFSGTAPTFDQLAARFRVGGFSFEAMHALLEYRETGYASGLDEDERVFLTGHRMVVGGGWGSVGLGEVVVYSSVVPDPAYLNPLAPFYLSQHNERENDNVLWLLDFVWHAGPGVEAYGEFVVDDLQYERSTDHPDKYGATLGAAWYGRAAGFDLEVTAEYSNVRKWTYTHSVIEHALVHDGLPVGFALGPDADRFTIELVGHPATRLSVGLTYQHTRKGAGNLYDPFVSGDNPEPTFPSGVVETTGRFSVELGYQSLERLSAGVGAAWESIDNVENVSGQSDDAWEFWAGVRFRI